MKKRFTIITLILLIGCMALFTGCSPKENSEKSSKQAELLLWMPPFGSEDSLDLEFWTEAIKPWSEENNVKVNIEITPWGGYEEKYLTGFSSGEGPDVGYMYLEMLNDFIEMGTLADIDSYFTEEDKANYLYYSKGNMKGGQYTLPFIVGNARIPYFNMDILKKAGIEKLPATWEELVQTAIKVKDANLEGVIPFAQEWADPAIGALNNIYYPYLWQAGGEIYSKDGSRVTLLDTEAGVKAAQFLYDLHFKYKVIPDECMAMDGKAVRNEFMAGHVAIASMDAKSGGELTKAGINWSFIPSFKDKNKAIWVASDALVMGSKCENKELAASLMKYMTSTDVMAKFHTELSTFPPITVDEAYNDNPAFREMYETETQYFHTLPVAEGAFKVMDVLYKNLQLMMLGDLSPEEAIKNTVDYSSSIIK